MVVPLDGGFKCTLFPLAPRICLWICWSVRTVDPTGKNPEFRFGTMYFLLLLRPGAVFIVCLSFVVRGLYIIIAAGSNIVNLQISLVSAIPPEDS